MEDTTIVKTIRFDKEMVEKIQKMSDESERGFSAQVRFMLKEYIRLKENK